MFHPDAWQGKTMRSFPKDISTERKSERRHCCIAPQLAGSTKVGNSKVGGVPSGTPLNRGEGSMWYATSMDGPIIGPYRTKRDAVFACFAKGTRRIEYGCYETIPIYDDGAVRHSYYIGTRANLERMGVDFASKQ